MIFLGAGGLAVQIRDVIDRLMPGTEIVYFDETENAAPEYIHTTENLLNYIKDNDPSLVMALSNIPAKKRLYHFLNSQGLNLQTIIAKSSLTGLHECNIGPGCTILENTIIESKVTIGACTLINSGAKLFHNSRVGDFCEIAPNATLLGNCTIGNEVFVGAGAIILPGIKIGDNCRIGAGSVVTKNVESGRTLKGNPAV